ncbi:MAG TPA: hypothetical protein VGO57_11460 [Verrucomicrobiae bacterium]|jgi:hypothetical protein
MKANHLKQIIVLTGCAAVLVGCAQQQNQPQNAPPGATSAAPASVKSGTVSAYFPTGKADSGGLLVEKIAASQTSGYSYKVSNLTDTTLAGVTVSDQMSGAYSASNSINSDLQPTINGQGIATWQVGSLGAKQSKIITIKGLPMDKNTLITCGWTIDTPVARLDVSRGQSPSL